MDGIIILLSGRLYCHDNNNYELGECRYSRQLPPGKLIVGYANWNQCDDKIADAVVSGVNVVIWFAINLCSDQSSGLPYIQGGPDMACVAEKIQKIRNLNLTTPTTHLISIGGWNAPHPDTSHSASEMYDAWRKWNTETIVDPDRGFYGFDGFDWDIEGNDDMHSPFNTFTPATLDLMGEMSQKAKRDGWVVAIAPMESYLDPYTEEFSREVTQAYAEWSDLQPNFKYHGRNVYAYLLARYGETILPAENSAMTDSAEMAVDTFDFVTVQLYEGYSHVQYKTQVLQISPAVVLCDLIRRLYEGWTVDFSHDKELEPFPSSSFPSITQRRKVEVKKTQLVIGLANGWAGDGKFLLLYRDSIAEAYRTLLGEELEPRGFAFWNILDEGKEPPKGDFRFKSKSEEVLGSSDVDLEEKKCEDRGSEDKSFWIARDLNSILHIRDP